MCVGHSANMCGGWESLRRLARWRREARLLVPRGINPVCEGRGRRAGPTGAVVQCLRRSKECRPGLGLVVFDRLPRGAARARASDAVEIAGLARDDDERVGAGRCEAAGDERGGLALAAAGLVASGRATTSLTYRKVYSIFPMRNSERREEPA